MGELSDQVLLPPIIVLVLIGVLFADLGTGAHCTAISANAPCGYEELDGGHTSSGDALYAEMLARARRQVVSRTALALMAAAASRENETIRHASDGPEIYDADRLFLSKYRPQTAHLYARPFCEIIARVGRRDWFRGLINSCRRKPGRAARERLATDLQIDRLRLLKALVVSFDKSCFGTSTCVLNFTFFVRDHGGFVRPKFLWCMVCLACSPWPASLSASAILMDAPSRSQTIRPSRTLHSPLPILLPS